MQSFTAIGRLGRDGSTKETRNGKMQYTNTLALDESYRQDNEKIEKVVWANIVAYGRTAEILDKYTKKGSLIGIVAKYDKFSFEDDGEKRFFDRFVVNSVQLLDKKSDSSSSSSSKASKSSTKKQQEAPAKDNDDDFFNDSGEITDDDIPF